MDILPSVQKTENLFAHVLSCARISQTELSYCIHANNLNHLPSLRLSVFFFLNEDESDDFLDSFQL